MTQSEIFWDKTAQQYAKKPVADELNYHKKLAQTQSFFTPNMRILEFGCGTGTTAVQHAPYVQHVDAIDISNKMLEIGRDNARQSGIENIKFTHTSLSEFDAAAASLDVVLGLNVIHLLSDRQAVIAEVARILKPGGIFVSNTVCLGRSYLRFIKLAVPLGKRLGLMPDLFILSETELATEITSAGFVIERRWHHGKSGISVFMIARKA